jgi:hypothetical protein
LCVGLEQLLDNSLVASNDDLNLMSQLPLQYTNTLSAPQSVRCETTGDLQNTATLLLFTNKIAMSQHLADSQELEQHPIVQPEQQPAAAIQVKPVVEGKAQEKETEIVDDVKDYKYFMTKNCEQMILPMLAFAQHQSVHPKTTKSKVQKEKKGKIS